MIDGSFGKRLKLSGNDGDIREVIKGNTLSLGAQEHHRMPLVSLGILCPAQIKAKSTLIYLNTS